MTAPVAPTRRTRLARPERREQIVDAAALLFRGRATGEVTFEEIADAVGVSRALVYNYFGDRNGLISAVYQRSVRTLNRRVLDAIASSDDLGASVQAAVRANMDFAREDPAGYRYAFGDVTFTGIRELEEERVRLLAARYGGSREAMVVARGLLSAVHAMVMRWLDDDRLDDATTESVITAFLAGALTQVTTLGVRFEPTR